jgi:hypothetical protein
MRRCNFALLDAPPPAFMFDHFALPEQNGVEAHCQDLADCHASFHSTNF